MKRIVLKAWPTVIALTICVALSSIATATTVIVPNSLAGTEGNISNSFPFDISFPLLTSMRYQQVFASSQFAALAPGGEFITQIAFRPDGGIDASAFSTTLPSIQIDLSTTSAAPDALSTTFANNVGANDTVVFGLGPLTLSSADSGGPPRNFDIVINLTTPFFYNPAQGNLLVDVRNFGGGFTTFFDAVFATGDSVSRVFSDDVTAATGGQPDSIGLVAQFTTRTVPEPSSLLLVGFGLVGLGIWRRRRKAK